jgi:hypothetical protein
LRLLYQWRYFDCHEPRPGAANLLMYLLPLAGIATYYTIAWNGKSKKFLRNI